MTELTHNQQLWVNLFIVFAFIFAVLAAGGYIIEQQEKKQRKQQDKQSRRRRKHKSQRQWENINNVYLSLGWFVQGMDKFNAICKTCEFQKDGKCFCPYDIAVFQDDTGAMADCSCYKKQECEKGQKNNYSEQHSE